MAKVLIIYFSETGNTEKMAKKVLKGVEKEKIDVEFKKVQETKLEDLLKPDGIIIGSPTYYGLPAAPIKKLLDESVKYHGKLKGKVGAAFSSAGGLGGGAETTILSILEMFLIHGMIIQGKPESHHYGAVSIGEPNKEAEQECEDLGRRIAKLVLKLTK